MIVDTQKALEKELERLKRASRCGSELHIRWMPSEKSISGEIRGSVICIYDFEETLATDTLHHEFIEYLMTKAIEPYRQLINKFVELFNEQSYSIKEKSIDGITNLLSEIRINNRPDKI